MATTIKEALVARLEKEALVEKDPQELWLLQDLRNKLLLGDDAEVELNYRRNLDLLQTAKLVADQLGAPKAVIEPTIEVIPKNPELIE